MSVGMRGIAGRKYYMGMHYLRYAGYVCLAAETNPRDTRVSLLGFETCAPPRKGFVKQGLTRQHKKSMPALQAARGSKKTVT